MPGGGRDGPGGHAERQKDVLQGQSGTRVEGGLGMNLNSQEWD